VSGRVIFQGFDLLGLTVDALTKLRGNRISFVPQNPTTGLSPAMRIGRQIAETLLMHDTVSDKQSAATRVGELLRLVGLSENERMFARYPHQLSGGQQQRVCIAMALACYPDLLVLDEPTTGLDVTTQEQILELLTDLRSRIGLAMLYVTHDLGVLAQIADRVGVMYAGHLVEVADRAELFAQPRHPYTRGLLASIPQLTKAKAIAGRLRGMLRRRELPTGCPFQPRCDYSDADCAISSQLLEPVSATHQVACKRWRAVVSSAPRIKREKKAPVLHVPTSAPLLTLESISAAYASNTRPFSWLFGKTKNEAIHDVSLEIAKGQVLALVGESGSGKSTIARVISGLVEASSGRILFERQPLPALIRDRSPEMRRQIQYVFQNPDASLNPRARIGTILARPLQIFFDGNTGKIREQVKKALNDVQLDSTYTRRFPDQLSGGERQRIAIARAAICDPYLLLCDEILSALDVSVQANIIDMLNRMRSERQLTMLFISHDLAVVRNLADSIAVLYRGQLMETGMVDEVFNPPFHPYTYSLLLSVPGAKKPKRCIKLPQSASAPVSTGCAFADRCPWRVGMICETQVPPWQHIGQSLRIRCHIPAHSLIERSIAPRNGEAIPGSNSMLP
jgi:peptide/nickel transport system ATP-binding protein